MQKVKIRPLSWLLVTAQFATMVYIFSSMPYTAHSLLGLLVQLGGIFLGFWAVLSMGLLNFSVFPEPKDKVKLVTSGCYQFIRHPMYAAVLLLTLPLIIDYFTYLRLLAMVILLIVGYIKIVQEEAALVRIFPDYKAYSETTDRLIPFVW
jgi:protein-S-isoprenylcysteine O-methyltransferase Ste14